jgi:hypothetical protein
LDTIELKFWRRHFGAIWPADGPWMREKLIFDLYVAVIAIADLISCSASKLSWRFV